MKSTKTTPSTTTNTTSSSSSTLAPITDANKMEEDWMSLLDFGEAREEDGGIVIGSPISTESMVSFETDSFASFEFNENSNNAYSAASVTGDLISPFTSAAAAAAAGVQFDVKDHQQHILNHHGHYHHMLNSSTSFHPASAFSTPRHPSCSSSSSYTSSASSNVSSSSSSSMASVCSRSSSFSDTASSVLSMLDLAAIDVVGGGRGVGDSVMNNVGDSTNAAASCLDAISAAGAGSVLAHHLAFSPESLLVKPNEVVCIPSAIEPPTNFVSDEDDENDEYDEVEEDDDDEQEIEEKRTTGIEFEYRLRSSKAAAATRAPPPTAYNTTPLSSPDSVPSFANIISTAASPTNLYSASSLSSCSTSSNRERVSSLSSTTSLDQFRSQLMIVKLNFLKRKKISPSPLPASVAPIPAIFDMEANDSDSPSISSVNNAKFEEDKSMSAPPPLPPRRLLLRIGGGGCGGGSSGNSCSSSSRLAANFQLDDVCSSENLNPCSTPTPFNKNSKKRRRNHVNDINNCAIIGGGERGDAGKIIKGDDYDNEDNEVVVGILKTAPNSPNINTNKKNPNTIATTLSNNIPRTPAFDLSDAALSKLGVTTKNTINHGVTTKNTINHNQISFKATPASTATGTGSGRRSRNSVAAAAFAAFTGASTMSGLANTRGVQRFSSAKSNMIVTRSSSRVV